MRTVLQKLLTAGWSAAVTGRGFAEIGGIVVEAGDSACLASPSALLRAYGIDQQADSVDVIRFELPLCASLKTPSDTAKRPWPTYPSGFLHQVGDQIVPVWELSWSRLPPRSELWRIYENENKPQELISVYRGAAMGWTAARAWSPPGRFVGTRASFQGAEYAADVLGDRVALTSFTDPGAPGWEELRPSAWSRVVPLSGCDVFELFCTAVWSGQRVRVLETAQGTARVQLQDPDPEKARTLGAVMVDPGVFEKPDVPASELSGMSVTALRPASTAKN